MHREILFELKEGEEPDWPEKLDKDVDVARFGLLAASNRPKDADPADRESCGDIIFEVSQGVAFQIFCNLSEPCLLP